MRTPEDLAADISGYRLEIPPTATTAELRTREDAERFFKAHPDAGGILQKLPLAKMTFPCTVTSGDTHPKTDFAEIGRMKDHIGRNWTCAEIILYETLLTSGPQKDIFSGLRNEAYAYMGAAVAASVMGTERCGGFITDYGDTFDRTISDLRGVLRKHGDIEGKLSEILHRQDETLRGQSETKHLLEGIQSSQLTRQHYDRVNGIKPDTRAKGAGAKRRYDLDGRQTDALLDLAKKNGRTVPTNADAAAIIRKGGNFQNPYTKRASLLSAARRKAAK